MQIYNFFPFSFRKLIWETEALGGGGKTGRASEGGIWSFLHFSASSSWELSSCAATAFEKNKRGEGGKHVQEKLQKERGSPSTPWKILAFLQSNGARSPKRCNNKREERKTGNVSEEEEVEASQKRDPHCRRRIRSSCSNKKRDGIPQWEFLFLRFFGAEGGRKKRNWAKRFPEKMFTSLSSEKKKAEGIHAAALLLLFFSHLGFHRPFVLFFFFFLLLCDPDSPPPQQQSSFSGRADPANLKLPTRCGVCGLIFRI